MTHDITNKVYEHTQKIINSIPNKKENTSSFFSYFHLFINQHIHYFTTYGLFTVPVVPDTNIVPGINEITGRIPRALNAPL